METENFKRSPGIEKDIGNLTEGDYRVRLFGTVVNLDQGNNFLLLDDGTGRIGVYFHDSDSSSEISNGNLIRVIGKVLPGENMTIDAEIIKDMSEIDIDLYKQVKKVIEN